MKEDRHHKQQLLQLEQQSHRLRIAAATAAAVSAPVAIAAPYHLSAFSFSFHVACLLRAVLLSTAAPLLQLLSRSFS